MVRNMEKVFIIIKVEESTKDNGFKIKNKVMDECNMPIKIFMKVIG